MDSNEGEKAEKSNFEPSAPGISGVMDRKSLPTKDWGDPKATHSAYKHTPSDLPSGKWVHGGEYCVLTPRPASGIAIPRMRMATRACICCASTADQAIRPFSWGCRAKPKKRRSSRRTTPFFWA